MVTQNGHHTVRVIVRIQLLLHGALLWRIPVKQFLEGHRRVIGTENLRGETLHVRREVPV